MHDFPAFMKNKLNAILEENQYSGIEGFLFEGKDGSQVVTWTCSIDGVSETDTHDFDEYMIVAAGRYDLFINNQHIPLTPGNEFYIPKGTPHSGTFIAGTRTIHAFGGKRTKRISRNQCSPHLNCN